MYVFLAKTISCFLIVIYVLAPSNLHAITVEISATVGGCGDGIIGVGEECDGSSLGGASCVSLGFSGGTLSCSLVCEFNTSSCSSSGGGGGGEGGGRPIPETNVVLTGRAYPLSRVSILKDGQLVLTTIAGPDSKFNATISGLSTGNYLFAVYGEDGAGISSSPFTFPIFISSGITTSIGGIFIAPTISLDKTQVRRGDTISIFGQTTPNSEVTININSEPSFFITEQADGDGTYLLNFNSAPLEFGSHTAKSKSQIGNEISPFGTSLGFLVGTTNIFNTAETAPVAIRRGDLNKDNRVNIIDFSIAAFWYRRPISSTFALLETERLNADGRIDLIDFSIMAFHWTG